jgi:hypothetical protein
MPIKTHMSRGMLQRTVAAHQVVQRSYPADNSKQVSLREGLEISPHHRHTVGDAPICAAAKRQRPGLDSPDAAA